LQHISDNCSHQLKFPIFLFTRRGKQGVI
jgi:hypothetical protein